MKFCANCAAPVVQRVPPGDSLPRFVCDECGEIHYQNPRLVVGCLPELDGRLLLCRRAIEPRYGYWTLPAGFMENGESVGQGALRETLEEAGARVELGAVFSMISVPRVNQVHLFFRARVIELELAARASSGCTSGRSRRRGQRPAARVRSTPQRAFDSLRSPVFFPKKPETGEIKNRQRLAKRAD